MTVNHKTQPGTFRAELLKLMPGYDWIVHKNGTPEYLEATGIQSSGFNRLSTIVVIRTERKGEKLAYEVKSSGFGLRAAWLHGVKEGTLARALRCLQCHYEVTAAKHGAHAEAMKKGRAA